MNIPDWIPEVVGLWESGGQYQERQKTLIKTERRQRLFSCCLIKRLLPIYNNQYPNDFRLYDIIKIAEQYADDEFGSELAKAHYKVIEIYREIRIESTILQLAVLSVISAVETAVLVGTTGFQATVLGSVAKAATSRVERINQSRLYGLFLPVKIDINWKTNSVTELAYQFYNGNTTIAPILADELEETGCDNKFWLRILRECPEVYHKGMTFIDNLIGK